MSKNIVVLSDGTAQEGGRGHDTNVYKLFKMLESRTRTSSTASASCPGRARS